MELNHDSNNPNDPSTHESLESKPLEVMILERSKLLQVFLNIREDKVIKACDFVVVLYGY